MEAPQRRTSATNDSFLEAERISSNNILLPWRLSSQVFPESSLSNSAQRVMSSTEIFNNPAYGSALLTEGPPFAESGTDSLESLSMRSSLRASGSEREVQMGGVSRASSHSLRNPVHGPVHRGIGRTSSKLIGEGVTLMWKDLRVTVSNKKNGGKRALLQNLNGFAEPGQVMAIMGPSGSGKSTLLDTLAGRLSSSIKQTGEILVNGRKQSLAYGTSAYVTQDDVLMATLTVWEAVFYSAQLQLPSSMSVAAQRERAESTIKEMGLQGAINTTIGGWRAKGLSGGEKRRVSIAIQILTRPWLLFLDEPTSGLDSNHHGMLCPRYKGYLFSLRL